MTVVALLPTDRWTPAAADAAAALRAAVEVDRVVVVCDGTDEPVEAARLAGAEVLHLPTRRGRSGALVAAAEAVGGAPVTRTAIGTDTPDDASTTSAGDTVDPAVTDAPDVSSEGSRSDTDDEVTVFVVVDPDLGSTALDAARAVLAPVAAGEAAMAHVGPEAGTGPEQGGRLARWALRRGRASTTAAIGAPAWAVRAELLHEVSRPVPPTLELALSVDAAEGGHEVVAVAMPDSVRSTSAPGSSSAGALAVARTLWPRALTTRSRVAIILVLLVIALGVTYTTSQAAEPTSIPPSEEPGSVVIFGVPRLGMSDLGSGAMPTLDRLVEEGATASMTVRTLRARATTPEAYATLSAGTRVRGFNVAGDAFAPDAEIEGSTAREVGTRRTGREPEGEVVVVGAAETVRLAGTGVSTRPGALADSLAEAGLRTAVVGNADIRTQEGVINVSRPAAVAAMDSAGGVDVGLVDGRLLRQEAAAPYGLATDPRAFRLAANRAMAGAALTVLDPGETDRAASYSSSVGVHRAAAMRQEALARTDELLATVVEDMPDDALLLVLGLTPPGGQWELTPAVAYGAGVEPGGQIFSAATRREALVTLTDVPATVLDALGRDVPAGMIGRPFRYRAEAVDLDALEQANATAAGRESIYYPMALTFIIAQALGYLFAILALTMAGAPGRFVSTIRVLVLTFAAWPLATFLVRMVPVAMTWGAGTHALTWAVALGATGLALRARHHPLAPLAAITTATVALLVVDVATGARLQSASILGYSPHTAARFTGFGNTAFAVLGACAIMTAVVMVDRRRTRVALVAAAAFLTFVVVVDGAPWLGSDVGGILSLVPTYALIVFALSGRRLSWRAVAVAGAATAVMLAIALGIDFLRPPESRTHLARFVTDAGRDGATFWTTIERKWATNLRVFGQSIWTWMVPIIATFSVYVLVIAKGWRRLLPVGSPLRVGAIGTITAGVLGWLVNDSGVVITALVFVYLGPYLTLIAIADRAPAPALLTPLTGRHDPEGPGPGSGPAGHPEPV